MQDGNQVSSIQVKGGSFFLSLITPSLLQLILERSLSHYTLLGIPRGTLLILIIILYPVRSSTFEAPSLT